MDSKYPPWETVFYHFTQFKVRGIWEEILDSVVIIERKRQEKYASPSLLAIDSQSVKKMQFISQETGIDGGKNVNGRKRTILVDTLGLPLSIKVTGASISDNQAGILAVDRLKGKVPGLQKITADKGYKNTFIEYVSGTYGWEVEIAQNRTAEAARINYGVYPSKEPLATGPPVRWNEALVGSISGDNCSGT